MLKALKSEKIPVIFALHFPTACEKSGNSSIFKQALTKFVLLSFDTKNAPIKQPHGSLRLAAGLFKL